MKWKQVHGPCLISFTENEIFQVFYPAYAKKKKNLSSDTYCKARSAKLPNYTVYEWRKSRHAPIVMHKIIVFWTLHMGVIYMYVYIHNQFETSNCWNRLCHPPPPFFLLFTITIYALFNFCCWIAQVGHLEGQE